eukprot:713835_1
MTTRLVIPPPKRNHPRKQTLNVVNWNLHDYGQNEQADITIMRNVKQLAKGKRLGTSPGKDGRWRYDPHDVIVFQEVESHGTQFDHLKKPFVDAGYEVISNEGEVYDVTHHSVVMFVKGALYVGPAAPQFHRTMIRYPDVKHYCRAYSLPGRIVGASLDLDGHRVFVFGTHLKNGPSRADHTKRIEGVACIKYIITDDWRLQRAPVKVVIGDMNTEEQLPFFTTQYYVRTGKPREIDYVYANIPVKRTGARPSPTGLSDHMVLLAQLKVNYNPTARKPFKPAWGSHGSRARQDIYGDYYDEYDPQFEYNQPLIEPYEDSNAQAADVQFEDIQLEPLIEPYDYNNGVNEPAVDVQLLFCILLFVLICGLISAAYGICGCFLCFVGYDALKKQNEMEYEPVMTQIHVRK